MTHQTRILDNQVNFNIKKITISLFFQQMFKRPYSIQIYSGAFGGIWNQISNIAERKQIICKNDSF